MNSRPMPSGVYDMYGIEALDGDTIMVPGSKGPIKSRVVLLEEPGYNGFYAEDISDLGGMSRTQRVLLSAIDHKFEIKGSA